MFSNNDEDSNDDDNLKTKRINWNHIVGKLKTKIDENLNKIKISIKNKFYFA